MNEHNEMSFTTKDRDNDRNTGKDWSNANCAVAFRGAWWYTNCYWSNLNGDYSRRDEKGVAWTGLPGSEYMKSTRMLLKCGS